MGPNPSGRAPLQASAKLWRGKKLALPPETQTEIDDRTPPRQDGGSSKSGQERNSGSFRPRTQDSRLKTPDSRLKTPNLRFCLWLAEHLYPALWCGLGDIIAIVLNQHRQSLVRAPSVPGSLSL